MLRRSLCTIAVLALTVGSTWAADFGLTEGTAGLKSAGPLAFGPDGILFVGDPQSGAVFALDTGEESASPGRGPLNVAKVDTQIAATLGTTADQILINDLAVSPTSGNAFLSVSRGRGPDSIPVIVRIDRSRQISVLPLDNIKHSKAALTSVADGRGRREAITDLVFIRGTLYVAGLSNEEFASTLRSIPFPFEGADQLTSVEVYHGAHGKFETRSPVRTFAFHEIGDEAYLLAAYTCTPLVKFPLSVLKPGTHVKGTTVAELGNRNRPLDMIVYIKGGDNFILMANSSRGVMKIATEGIDKIEGITERVARGGTAGLTYETIDSLKGVLQLDKLDKGNALIIAKADDGALNLETVPLP